MSTATTRNNVTARLRAALDCRIITPEDPAYDEARTVFYSGFDRRPAAIVRPVNAQQVSRAILLAREAELPLAVRGGGHSLVGHGVCDGGVVLDLSQMRRLDIDPAARTAWAWAGLTAGEYTAAAGAHGLATGFGDTGSVGIGGLTLNGGVGFLHRKHGLTIDSLLAAEIVTSDGQILHSDTETHPDLFWAVRGGGGNFGVVTRFRFRLEEVDQVVGGMLMLPATPDVLTTFVGEAHAASEELSGMINVMMAPPMPFIPAEHHGRPVVMALLVHAGPADAAERALDRLRSLAPPVVDTIRRLRYPEMYEGGPAPRPSAITARSTFIDGFEPMMADTILAHLETSTAPIRVAQLRVLGEAVARVPAEATAFAHRQRGILVNIGAGYGRLDEAAEHDAWATRFAMALRRGEPGAYVGFLCDEGQSRVREAYPASTWDRLTAIKTRYDPTNLFRHNQNIPPAPPSGPPRPPPPRTRFEI